MYFIGLTPSRNAVVNSMIVTLRQQGIRWRDTFYPLEMLRAGNVP
jgi:hypothetical protein